MTDYLSVEGAITLIGRIYNYPCQEMIVKCKIISAKQAYGLLRIKVSPVAGFGEKWTTFRFDYLDNETTNTTLLPA